jgi:hypothetical protein
VQVLLPPDELAAIDEFRFRAENAEPRGCGSRTAQARWLRMSRSTDTEVKGGRQLSRPIPQSVFG